MKREWQGDREVWTAGSVEGVAAEGWRVLGEEQFKPGVKRVSVTKESEFRMVYMPGADDE